VTRGAHLFNTNIADCKGENLCTVGESCPVAVCQDSFQRVQALLNDGSNYDSLKVNRVALVKSGYMLENLAYLVLGYSSGDRGMTPKNSQVETISRKDLVQIFGEKSSETIRQNLMHEVRYSPSQ
jgi:hypothetical protein